MMRLMTFFGSSKTSSSELNEVGLSWAAANETERKRIVRVMNDLCIFVMCLLGLTLRESLNNKV